MTTIAPLDRSFHVRTINFGQRLWFALCLAILLASTSAAQTRRTVILSGTTKSVSGTNWRFLNLGSSVINADGEVAFTALAERTAQPANDLGSIWWESGAGAFKLVAADGDTAPGTDGADYKNLLYSHASLNAPGQVAYRGSIADTGILATNDSGFWITTNSQTSPELIFREGSVAEDVGSAVFDEQSYDTTPPAPGIPIPTYPLPVPTLNADGRVAALTRLQLSIGSVSVNDDSGIWYDGKSFSGSLVARENGAARGVTSPVLNYGDMTVSPRLNDNNNVAFTAPLRSPITGVVSGAGVWVGSTGGPTLQTRTDSTARIDSAVFNTFQEPTLNNRSTPEFAFAASLKLGSAVTADNDQGIWSRRRPNDTSSSSTQLEVVVREGLHAPGTPATVGFGNLPETLTEPTFDGVNINSVGRIAFRARLRNLSGTAVNAQNDTGLWVRELGLLDVLETNTRLIAREGDLAPGTTDGALFGTLPTLTTEPAFSEPTINSLGQVAWMAHLRGSGVTAANDTGIWVKNGAGATLLLAREGFPLDVNDGTPIDNRTVSSLSMWTGAGGEDGRRNGLNSPASGLISKLVFSATFTDNFSGVFVVTLPPLGPPPVPGDYNGNGIVDLADYTRWRDSMGQMGAGLAADGNGDGRIDNADYDYWKEQYRAARSGAGGSLGGAVPEPSFLPLAASTLVGMMYLRRRSASPCCHSARELRRAPLPLVC